ncbi:MAG: MFS transporter [Gemmatimonadaceae bacterium]
MHKPHPLPVETSAGDIIAVRAPARERWSWILYDFANTIFSMNVVSLFFVVWLVKDLGASNTVAVMGSVIASVLVALSIPIFGAISDATQRRKPWVVWFTLLAVAATAALGVLSQTIVPLSGEGVIGGLPPGSAAASISGSALAVIIIAFIVANYAYQGALPFYNAMMPELAPASEWGRLSGTGAAIGYVGSITGVLIGTAFYTGSIPIVGGVPEALMSDIRAIVPFTEHAGRVSTFVPTAILFLLFSLPLFFFCRDHRPAIEKRAIEWKKAFRDVIATFRESRKYPGATRFIVASFLYQDAMGTIIGVMALYAVEAMGFVEGSEAILFVVLTVPAVLGSYFWGMLADRIGPKRTIVIVITSWIFLLTAMIMAPTQTSFWVVGVGIGLVYGGVAATERPLLLTLIPERDAGRFFGLMVLSARAAAIAGPLIWAVTVDGLMPSMGKGFAYRAGVVTVGLGMVFALWVMRKVPDKRGYSEEGTVIADSMPQ